MHAHQINGVRRRKRERDRLQDPRKQGHGEGHAGHHREDEARCIDEEVRFADEQHDCREDVGDPDHRAQRQEDRRHGDERVWPEPQAEKDDAEPEQGELRADEPEHAPQGATDDERLVPRRGQP